MEQGNQGCQIPEHDSEEIISVCVTSGCKQKYSVLCVDCLISGIHKKCKYVVKIKDLQKPGFQINNFPTDCLFKLNRVFCQGKDEKLMEIEDIFQKLEKCLVYELQQIKEDLKQQVQDQVDQGPEFEEIKIKIQEKTSLEPLKESIQQFKDQQITLQELNRKISSFSSQNHNDIVKEISQSYEHQTALKQFDINFFNSKKDSLTNQLSILKKSYRLPRTNDLKLVQILPQYGILDEACLKYTDTQCTGYAVMTTSFQKDDYQQFTFMCDDYSSGQMYFGVASKQQVQQNQCMFFSEGAQICLCTGQQNTTGRFKKTKDFQQNSNLKINTFKVEVCLSRNQFDIRDKDGTLLFENQYKFDEQQNDDWVFVWGSDSYMVEILD